VSLIVQLDGAGLAQALARDELHVDYLPIVGLGSGDVEGVEALLRWDRQPAERCAPEPAILEEAERSGELIGVGHWVLATALADVAAAGPAADGRPLRLSVNVSLGELVHPELPQAIEAALARCGHPADALYLEVSEGVVLRDEDRVRRAMRTLKELGVRISIDDFGTGASSLAVLQALPIDELKIDRSFVGRMHEDPRSAAIARSVAYLARSLGIRTLAEGVELDAQERMLVSLRCASAQGWLYARATPGIGEALQAVDTARVRARLERRPGMLWSSSTPGADRLVDDAFAHASIGMGLIDGTGAYLAVNSAMVGLLGATVPELVGRSCFDDVHPDDVAADQARLDAVLTGASAGYALEERYVDARGVARWVEVTVTSPPEPAGAGEPVRLLRQVRSIEDRKRATDSLERANRRLADQARVLTEANGRLATFAGSVSHDLQQPLTALGGFLHLLAAHGDGIDGDAAAWLEAALRSHRRVTDAVHALVETAIGSEVELAPVDLAAVFTAAAEDLDAELGSAGATIAVESLPSVLGDRAMLERVAANLLSNACRYRDDRRPLRIRVRDRSQDGDRTVVEVADNGRGFAADELESVFAAGRRGAAGSDRPGTGTGLAIVRSVIAGLGGHVWAERGPDGGAVVCLALNRA
jgi:PAS domain S-box-containing protein